MEIKAQAKFIRMSPRKTRLVVDLIQGLDVEAAIYQLKFMTKAAARPVLKLLNSGIANAVNNFKLQKDNLYVKSITVDGGPILKRWQPRAFGRATPIRKRSCHISIILAERKVGKEIVVRRKVELEKPQVVDALKKFRQEKVEVAKAEEKRPEKVESAKKEFKKTKGFLSKIFHRTSSK